MKHTDNNIKLIGHIEQAPKVAAVDGGIKMSRFSFSTVSDCEEKKAGIPQTYNLVAWGKGAEKAGKQLQKGQKIAVKGRLYSKCFENDRYIMEVMIRQWMVLGD